MKRRNFLKLLPFVSLAGCRKKPKKTGLESLKEVFRKHDERWGRVKPPDDTGTAVFVKGKWYRMVTEYRSPVELDMGGMQYVQETWNGEKWIVTNT